MAAPFLVAVLVAAAVVLTFNWRRASKLADQWALRHGARIRRRSLRIFWRGPFTLGSGGGDVVFRVLAETSDGAIRSGWLRCNTGFLGRLAGRVDVMWDQPPGFPVTPIVQDQRDS